ncbi:papain fold toxin 1 (glutamine deamidase) of polymorphic toxin system [Nonomuraea polychroma]|uniref:Papain fold toxin 1 (Glutamine deamidase) of polymorphic toxin system n=1 Tax=Nonomuraea polychroma TaxID=46176 RepID=A0A438MRT3_9ACTN|nr:papain fold toxin 1 (glutamine deamidase) of polymorphic toxin system [Nonomuraea polychroma]
MFHERKPSVRWVLPEGQYNPLVGEGMRWLDYERAAEVDAAPMPGDGAAEGTTTLEPVDVPEPVDTPGAGRPGDAPPPSADSGPAFLGECRAAPAAESGLAPLSGYRATPAIESGVAPAPDSRAAPAVESRTVPPSNGEGATVVSDLRFDLLEVPAERTTEGDWFERPHRPPRLADCRPYGVPGGLAQPDPQVERDLIEALPPGTRFPDPRGTWIRLINGGGPADDPFRASNAADCALAVMSTWHGEPATAAPRLPEYDRIGRPLLTGERDSRARIERWVGQRLEYAGQGRHAYPMIARRLIEAAHGACAVIVVRWPGGGTHAWNAVNADGEVIWIDAQRGHMSVEPPYTTVTGVFCVILDRQGQPR